MIVYPKIVALRDLGFPSQSPFGTLPSRERIFEDPTRIQGVRDYQPGDSLRRMDWKTSARVGSLQVRRYEPAIALETAILLNLNRRRLCADGAVPATEMGIVVAASVAVHLVEKRQAVGLATNGRDPLRCGEARATASCSLPAAQGPRAPDEPAGPAGAHRGRLRGRGGAVSRSAVPAGAWVCPGAALWSSSPRRRSRACWTALLTLRRRGLVVILVLTCPDRGYAPTAQRAGQIGVQTLRIWSEQALDVWR